MEGRRRGGMEGAVGRDKGRKGKEIYFEEDILKGKTLKKYLLY